MRLSAVDARASRLTATIAAMAIAVAAIAIGAVMAWGAGGAVPPPGDVYVESPANGGSDTMGVGTKDEPYATVAVAMQNVTPGNTIFIGPGEFECIDRTLNTGVSIQGAGASRTTLTGKGKAGILKVDNAGPEQRLAAISFIDGRGDMGGAIYVTKGRLTIERCVFTGNHSNGSGGVLEAYGAEAVVSIKNCVMYGNDARLSAGAVYAMGGAEIEVEGCTVWGNWAEKGPFSAFDSVYADRFTVRNSIVWDNFIRDPIFGRFVGPEPNQLGNSYGQPIAVTYSDIEGGYDGTGNIDSFPRFGNPEVGVFSLMFGSPVIDMGTSAVLPTDDLLGVARPQGRGVDMGACEFVFSPRVARDDTAIIDEDVPGKFNIYFNDDISELTLNWGVARDFSQPSHGTIQTSPSGDVTYTPPPNWNGETSFTYVAEYETTQSAPATVRITVRPVQDAPVALNDTANVFSGTSLAGKSVLINDTDADGEPLTAVRQSMPAHGTLVFNLIDGTYVYTPDPGFSGIDSFTYKAFDGIDYSDIVTVTITVQNAVFVATPANGGSDSTGDGTPAKPYETMVKAMNQVPAGLGINVGPGTFECVNFTVKDGVWIRGSGSSATTLTANGKGSVLRYASTGSGESLSDVTITGGVGAYGGGVNLSSASPTITACTITGNSAVGNGGGISCEASSSPTVIDSVITNNTAQEYFGGGVYAKGGSAPRFVNCTIASNRAVRDGGAVYAQGATSRVDVASSRIVSNSAGFLGGGISLDTSAVATVTSSTIASNSAGTNGGAVHGKGRARIDISTSELYSNSSGWNGGAVYLQNAGAVATITASTIASNSATLAGGGIVATASAGAIVRDSIVWRNTSSESSQAIGNGLSATYSDIGGGRGGIGNINADPLFRDRVAGDYRLSGGSPVIDTATSTVSPATDRLGIVRPQGVGVDMGAHEYVFTPRTARNDSVTTTAGVPVSFNVLANDDPSESTVAKRTAVFSGVPTGAITSPSGDVTYTPSASFEGTATFTYRANYVTSQAATATVIIRVNAAPAARDVYVETWGDDANVGSRTSPFKTVAGAMSKVGPGFTIQVGPGTFECTELSVKDDVWIVGAGASETTLTANGKGRVLIYNSTGTGESLSDVTITGAAGKYYGGGIYLYGSSPTITDCVITGNSTTGAGGGLWCQWAAPTLIGCTISSNTAVGAGGAIKSQSASSPTLIGCTIASNKASWSGGAIFAQGSSRFSIDSCEFVSNSSARHGGAIYLEDSGTVATITASTIASNSAGEDGGAVYVQSAARFDISTSKLVSNSSGDRGGAIYLEDAGTHATIMASTIASNSASSWGGGVAASFDPRATVTNSIVWDNTSRQGLQAGAADGAVLTATYSVIGDGIAGTGNIDADPRFRDAAAGDYRLSAGSPAIDTATSTAAPATDLLGVARPQGVGVDMGAYEYVFTPRVARSDSATTTVGAPVSLNVLANDDPSESTVASRTAIWLSLPAVGTITTSTAGDVTYTPPASFEGTATFTYRANYVTSLTAPATVTIRVNAAPVNQAPKALDDSAVMAKGTVLTGGSVLLNDTDADGNTLSAWVETTTAHGTFLLNTVTGTYTYTPQAGFTGTDFFTYKAFDGTDFSNVATVRITVKGDMYVSTSGDDDTGNGSEAMPYESMARAMTEVLPGFSVRVGSGTFTCVNLTVKDGVSIIGAGASETTLTAGGAGGVLTYSGTKTGESLSALTITGGVAANGGGIYLSDSSPSISECVITRNLGTQDGGGIFAKNSSHPVVARCVITSNTSANNGGGIYLFGLGTGATVTSSTISANTAAGWRGGGIFAGDQTLLAVSGSVITSNNAPKDGGGGICLTRSTGTLTNLLIAGNSASVGGGLATFLEAVATVRFSTLTGNTAVLGGGIYSGGYAQFFDSVLWGNTAPSGPNVSGAGITHNNAITTDPLFRNAAAGDYRLSGGSPAIDTATSSTVPATDLLGVVRPQGVGADRGAYEYEFTPRVARDDSITTTVGVPVSFNVLTNDDPSESTVASHTAIWLSRPAVGTITTSAAGDVTYTPPASFEGTATFTYRANYVTSLTATTTVTIRVTAAPPVNHAPVAVNDTATVTSGSLLLGTSVLANDSDVDAGTTLVPMLKTLPSNAETFTLNPDGTYIYRSKSGFSGTDTFTYQASDGTALSNTATVTITVTATPPVNHAPVAVNDTATVVSGTTLVMTTSVLANDYDADYDSLAATLVAGPTHAADFQLGGYGSYVYTPQPGFTGTDTFTYQAFDGTDRSNTATVTITVSPAPPNHAPVAVNDTATAVSGTTLAGTSVLANDSDADTGTTLAAVLVTAASHAEVFGMYSDGTYFYKAQPGFTGTDTFTYQAYDGTDRSNTATVTITVTAPPVDHAPVAVNDTATVTAGASTHLNVLANDTDIDTPHSSLVATGFSAPATGTIETAPSGDVTYTAPANFAGDVTFTYRASDGATLSAQATVTITVTAAPPVNHAPVAVNDAATVVSGETLVAPSVLANDSDPDGDRLTAVLQTTPSHAANFVFNDNGTYTYTPQPGFAGTETFTYKASDGTLLSAPATVKITVTRADDNEPVNHPPVAVSDGPLTTAEDTLLNVPAPGVLANDTDPDGDTLTPSLVDTTNLHGTLVFSAGGGFAYAPAKDFSGTATATYRVFDGKEYSGLATVTFDVTPVNDAPVAADDAVDCLQNGTASFNVLANDTDIDSSSLSAVSFTAPAIGRVQTSPTGLVTYTPPPNFLGTTSLTYQVTDGGLTSPPATVRITVTRAVVTRIGGADRYEAAANIARHGWDPCGTKEWNSVSDVIIANGEVGREADPLCAAGLAGVYDAPILLVRSKSIPAVTRTALTEIAAKNPGVRIHLVGGTSSVPDARWNEIKRITGVGPSRDRIGGPDRYAVSAGIARRMIEVKGTAAIPAVLLVAADDTDAFFDGLAAGPIAYANTMPLLAVREKSIPPVVASLLKGSLAGKKRYAVSSSTYIGKTPAKGAVRLATSKDRYTAASQIAYAALKRGWLTATEVGVTAKLPDALTGGAFLGKRGGVLLFTDSDNSMSSATKSYLSAHEGKVRYGWILGGTCSVTPAQEKTLRALLKASAK